MKERFNFLPPLVDKERDESTHYPSVFIVHRLDWENMSPEEKLAHFQQRNILVRGSLDSAAGYVESWSEARELLGELVDLDEPLAARGQYTNHVDSIHYTIDESLPFRLYTLLPLGFKSSG